MAEPLITFLDNGKEIGYSCGVRIEAGPPRRDRQGQEARETPGLVPRLAAPSAEGEGMDDATASSLSGHRLRGDIMSTHGTFVQS